MEDWYKWIFSGIGVFILGLLFNSEKSKKLLREWFIIKVKKRHFLLMAQKIGFQFNEYKALFSINKDGSSTSETTIKIKAVNGEISTRDHKIYTTGGGSFKDTDISVSGESTDIDSVLGKVILNDDHSINIEVMFSPALKQGGEASYTITRKNTKGLYAMTSGEVLQQIKGNKRAVYGLYEFSRCIVRFPTKSLYIKVTFPENYDVIGEHFFDVFTGQSWDRAEGEFQRIKKEGTIKKSNKDNKPIIELSVPYPEIGLSYTIKWIPPDNME